VLRLGLSGRGLASSIGRMTQLNINRFLSTLFGSLLGLFVFASPVVARAALTLCDQTFLELRVDAVLSEHARELVNEWIFEDRSKVISYDHASSVRAVTSSQGFVKTKFAVQMIHGLYNSPKWMDDIGRFFHAGGMNVVNTRLPGHYEKQHDALDRVNRSEWVSATESGFRVATELGERVIIVGHSTGGVLASMQAVKRPDRVAAVVLFAPAYRLTTMSWIKAAVSSRANIGYVEESTGRYISGDAGQQVVMLGKEFWAELAKENPSAPVEVLRKRLHNIPILMVETALDKTVDVAFNRIVMQVLSDGAPSVERNQVVLQESDQTPHNAITLENNGSGASRSHEKVKSALAQFLERIGIHRF
jgi:esterase/lipase